MKTYEAQPREFGSLPIWHGIYFLCSREGISYVGKSERDEGIRGRLWEHWQHSNKPFGYVILLSLVRDRALIDKWEKAAISTFSPERNKTFRDPRKPILNDVMQISVFISRMGDEQVREIARIEISNYYDGTKAELDMPYRNK